MPQPDFLDPFSGAIFSEPVTAEDGRNYEEANIKKWIAQQAEAKLPLESPTLHTPMGPKLTPNAQLKKRIKDARTKHTELLAAAGGVLQGRGASISSAPPLTAGALSTASGKHRSKKVPSEPTVLRRVDELGEIFESLDSLTDFLRTRAPARNRNAPRAPRACSPPVGALAAPHATFFLLLTAPPFPAPFSAVGSRDDGKLADALLRGARLRV